MVDLPRIQTETVSQLLKLAAEKHPGEPIRVCRACKTFADSVTLQVRRGALTIRLWYDVELPDGRGCSTRIVKIEMPDYKKHSIYAAFPRVKREVML